MERRIASCDHVTRSCTIRIMLGMPCVSTTRCTIRFDTIDKHDIGFVRMDIMIGKGTRKIRHRRRRALDLHDDDDQDDDDLRLLWLSEETPTSRGLSRK